MTDIKAIETRYKGYRFRSRLEARWAVFFDAIGTKWEYEVEGFELPDGRRYLPDFKVTTIDGDTWYYEIKGTSGQDDGKLKMLIDAIRAERKAAGIDGVQGCKYVLGAVLFGDPYHFIINCGNRLCPRCMQFSIERIAESDFPNGESVYCFPCDAHTPCGRNNDPETHSGRTVIPDVGDLIFLATPENKRNYTDLIVAACRKARSARFEFGERK